MIFEFNQQLLPQSMISIENMGTFAIRGLTDEGAEYYLVAKNVMGMVHMLSWGPVIPDMDFLLNGYSCSYTKSEYKEQKLEKTINLWLNDRGKKITNAELVEPDEALSSVIDVRKQMWNIEETADGD